MEKTQKSPEVEALLEQLAPYGRGGQVCAICGSDKVAATDFRDELSRREWSISLMCQKCQDEVFGG